MEPHRPTEESALGALGALRDRLALTGRLLAAVWLGRRGEELLDGRLGKRFSEIGSGSRVGGVGP